jgi:tetratricopeptide (TPR) repeat protein
MHLYRCFLRILLLAMLGSFSAQAQTAPDAVAPSAQSQPNIAAITEKGLDALKANQPQQALDLFEEALKANPNDAAANLLAATAALSLYKGDLAVKYAEKARDVDPNNWKVHTTLVAAYAAAGKKEQRDQERETLRKLHDDPQAPEAMQTKGFLLEMFPVKQYKIEAIEYFHPVDKFHIYYRFLIRNSAGKRVWQIDVQSNDFDQASWAKAHPDEAATGKRQFQLVGEDRDLHMDYTMFSGTADYDAIRAKVVDVIQEQTAPFPGESAQ